jgi:hypothetical protein
MQTKSQTIAVDVFIVNFSIENQRSKIKLADHLLFKQFICQNKAEN